MATFIKAIGLMIKLTVKESTCITMEQYMRAPGKMTSSTVMALKPGLMRLDTKALTSMVPSTAMVNSIGTMVLVTLGNSAKMTFKGKEGTLGQMGETTKDNGPETRCMVSVFSNGMMAVLMKVNLLTIGKKVMECSCGKMEESMTVSGGTASKMGSVSLLMKSA